MLKKICLTPTKFSIIKQNFLWFASENQPNKQPSDFLKSQNKDFEDITIQKRPTKLPLKDTSIKKPTDYYDTKKGPFRESERVFNFIEPVLNSKS